MKKPASTRSLVTLRPAGDQLHLHANRLVLAMGLDGFVRGGAQGLFAHEARVLSEFRYLVNEEELLPVGVSPISSRALLGYYLAFPPGRQRGRPDQGSGLLIPDTQQTVELIVRRKAASRSGSSAMGSTTTSIGSRAASWTPPPSSSIAVSPSCSAVIRATPIIHFRRSIRRRTRRRRGRLRRCSC